MYRSPTAVNRSYSDLPCSCTGGEETKKSQTVIFHAYAVTPRRQTTHVDRSLPHLEDKVRSSTYM